jgi:hypothetical protein
MEGVLLGQLLTIYFNPFASELTPNSEYGIGFNGTPRFPLLSLGSIVVQEDV